MVTGEGIMGDTFLIVRIVKQLMKKLVFHLQSTFRKAWQILARNVAGTVGPSLEKGLHRCLKFCVFSFAMDWIAV